MSTEQLYEERELLVSRLIKGEMEAFNYFFREFYSSLFYYCRHLVQDEEEAKDIVLSGFYKFWERRTQFQNYLNVKSFLYLVVRNAGLNYLKQKKRKNVQHQDFLLATNLMEHETDYLAVEAETLKRVYKAIEQLPDKCREVFELSYINGKSVQEVAEILQISAANVSSQRYRALQLLRITLADSPLALIYLTVVFLDVFGPTW